MARIEIELPALGEGIIEATLTRWLVKEGQEVSKDDPIAEIATDKVDSEFPAPEDGILHKIMVHEGEIPKVGQTLAILTTGGAMPEEETEPEPEEELEQTEEARSEPDEKDKEPDLQEKEPVTAPPQTPEPPPAGSLVKPRFLTPVVRTMIKEEGLSEEEIRQIRGTGLGGRITRGDVLKYLEQTQKESVEPKPEKPAAPREKTSIPEPPDQEEREAPVSREQVYSGEGNQIEEMDRTRRLIAENMVYSKRVSPHVSSFEEADMTPIVEWRSRVKDEFAEREGIKLTYTPIIMEAVIRAIREYPMLNVSLDKYKIVKKKQIHMGMAAALPNGNLIVPVIHNADKLNLAGLAARVQDLATRARENKLRPNEITGGTFTLTNVGSFGNLTGIPIINQPQVAILAVGAIKKKPAVVETPGGDSLGIRHMMVMTLSYDHRIIDGALGGMFLNRIRTLLEEFDPFRTLNQVIG